jgi:hypothetical protein
MRAAAPRLLALPLAAILAACAGSTPTPAAQPTPPDDAAFLLRLETEQAIPPRERFGSTPAIVITLDGRALTAGPVPAIFPGPLVAPIVQRQVSAAGWRTVVELARASGLLSRSGQIGDVAPGETILRLRIVADGQTSDVTVSNQFPGCLSEPCQGPPGSPQAFFGFGSRLFDLGTFLGSEVGPEAPYLPEAYGVIVGPVPDDQGLPQPPIDWPFADGLGAFGEPFADGTGFRCGTVTGEDAVTLRDKLALATQISPWRDPLDGSLYGLTARPLLPGDGDPCAGIA